jgi:NAD(P)-dependent dehydrogenase (short-subunit alcohol dehydrogenase family)
MTEHEGPSLDGRFAGRIAVVTGAASGLGRASATLLAREGAHVIAVDLNGGALREVVANLATPGVAVEGDIGEPSTVERYMEAGIDSFGRVDLYHLNAGIFGTFAPLPDLEVEEFDEVMRVNLRGQFLGLRAAFRQYKAQRTAGAIVVTASIASLAGSADLLAYQTSKHGVVGLIRGAAMYGGPIGIRVNGVAPGIVPTELFASSAGSVGGKNDMERRASTTPLRRAGRADEIASVVSFLLSDESAYVTGQVLSADGGATIVNTVRPSGGAGAWDTRPVDSAMYGTLQRGVM